VQIVDQPIDFKSVTSPLTISGQIIAFEGTFQVALFDASGVPIVEAFGTSEALETGELGPFTIDVGFDVDEPTAACLWVYEQSAEDGSPIHVGQVPLVLLPTSAPGPTPTIPFDGTRAPVEKPGAPPAAQLMDVRIGLHDGFDRAVFEFEVGLPGYRVEYVEPPIVADASGLRVEIDGTAVLQVRFAPAAGHDPSTGEVTYAGPLQIASDLPSLVELQGVGDFEGQLRGVLGLTDDVDFRISELEAPFRVLIDVAYS
jgi:hypothetical protein